MNTPDGLVPVLLVAGSAMMSPFFRLRDLRDDRVRVNGPARQLKAALRLAGG